MTSLNQTPSVVQTCNEDEKKAMFGDDDIAKQDWSDFSEVGISLPTCNNDNAQPLSGVELTKRGVFPFIPILHSQWASLDRVGPIIFADEWDELWAEALTAALKAPVSTVNKPRATLISMSLADQLFTCKHVDVQTLSISLFLSVTHSLYVAHLVVLVPFPDVAVLETPMRLVVLP